MPVAQIPLSETDQLVARPVIVAVLEQIKHITNIPQDTDIVYIGENNQRIPLTHPTSSDQAPVKLAIPSLSSSSEEDPVLSSSALTADLPAVINAYTLQRAIPSARGSFTAPSPHRS